MLGLRAEVATDRDRWRNDGLADARGGLPPRDDGRVDVFAGTDDENYGAALRQVAPIP